MNSAVDKMLMYVSKARFYNGRKLFGELYDDHSEAWIGRYPR